VTRHLQQRGHIEVVVAVTEGGLLYNQLQASGLKVYGLPVQTRLPILRAFDYRGLFALLKVLGQEKPDLVHIHKGRIEQAMIRRAGFPLVYTYHSYGAVSNLENARNSLLRTLYKMASPLFSSLTNHLDGMLVVSHYERNRLYREGFLPRHFESEVLHNGLDIENIPSPAELAKQRDTTRASLGIPAHARVVGFFCRLDEDKNALAYLRIARQLLEHAECQQDVYLLVAGKGKHSAAFNKAFQEDSLFLKHGQYLGFCSNIPELLGACDLTVSVSRQEGFGLRILESLIYGKPCLTYAAGGIPEVLAALPGAEDWLVPNGAEDEFLKRLLRAVNLSDQDLQQLAPLLQAHSKRFDLRQHVEKLEAFYHKVLARISHPFYKASNPSLGANSLSPDSALESILN
jgi:glycosyltransferase involved in cell wall biosynthesis